MADKNPENDQHEPGSENCSKDAPDWQCEEAAVMLTVWERPRNARLALHHLLPADVLVVVHVVVEAAVVEPHRGVRSADVCPGAAGR